MDNHAIQLQQAIIAALKNDGAVQALVGNRVYDQVIAKPTWPFIRYGFAVETPWRASGWWGEAHALTIHCFARASQNGAGRDEVSALMHAVKEALAPDDDGSSLAMLGTGGVVTLQFAGSNLLRDTAEASAYHGVVEFEAATAEIAA